MVFRETQSVIDDSQIIDAQIDTQTHTQASAGVHQRAATSRDYRV